MRSYTRNVSPRSGQTRHDAKRDRVSHVSDNRNCVGHRFEGEDQGIRGRMNKLWICVHHLASKRSKTFLPPLCGVSLHNQVLSLNVAEATQLLEKGAVSRIVPGFTDVAELGRGMNYCNAVHLQ